MSLVERLFGRGRHASADQAAIDVERSRRLSTPTAQSSEERDSVRAHMEAELEAQRERRLQA
jgi:hypothetical protein